MSDKVKHPGALAFPNWQVVRVGESYQGIELLRVETANGATRRRESKCMGDADGILMVILSSN